jgi:serine/threonine protein kinase
LRFIPSTTTFITPRYVFHPSVRYDGHAETQQNSGRFFAIKCLISRNREEFKREADTLMKFSGDAHSHLVSLLATYEQFKKFYLIFPWAEADLKDYWKVHNPSPVVDYETVLWVAKQCHGIAEGLSKIHRYESSTCEPEQKDPTQKQKQQLLLKRQNSHLQVNLGRSAKVHSGEVGQNAQLYGRHGDIKPENILWFRNPNDDHDRGVLKITDFGLTEFSVNYDRSYKPRSKVFAASLSYRPPEFDLQDGLIGRSYDIWTLGCLYLELITWLLGGWELVEKFNKEREAFDPCWYDMNTDTFFEIVKCASTNKILAMVKPAVTAVSNHIHLDLMLKPSVSILMIDHSSYLRYIHILRPLSLSMRS